MYQYPDSGSPQLMQPPPGWAPYSAYYPGAVVWYAGTYWRCEAAHTSADEPSGAPTTNFQLWTPVSSSGVIPGPSYPSYPHGNYYQSYLHPPQPTAGHRPGPSRPPYHFQTQGQPPTIISPIPLPMPAKPPSPGTHDADDSPSSQGTVTGKADELSRLADQHAPPAYDEDEEEEDYPSRRPGQSSRGFGKHSKMDLAYFTGKATEGLRYLAIKEERYKAREKEELKRELTGKRVWRVGGVGVWTYSPDPAEEDMKGEVWREWSRSNGREEWLKAARARTDAYNAQSRGVKPLYMWKLVERGGPIPSDALPIGREEAGEDLFAARSWHEHGLHLGKAARHLPNGVSISWGGAELTFDAYEVLCGPADPALLKWMSFRHGERVRIEGWQPVEGGREADGRVMLLAKGIYESGDHPGKCLIDDDHICVGWGGGEVWVRPFEVLAYNSSSRR